MEFADLNLTLVLVLAIVIVLVFGRFVLGILAVAIMACLAFIGGIIALPVLWLMARMSDRRSREADRLARSEETRRVREQFERGYSRW